MLLPNTCLSLLPIASIFLAWTFPAASAPNVSFQTPNTLGDSVASKILGVLAAFEPSQSLHSSVSATSSTAAYNTSFSTSSRPAQASNSSSVSKSAGDSINSKFSEGLGTLKPSLSLQSSVSVSSSYTSASDTSVRSSSLFTQSNKESGVLSTAVGRFRQSASFNMAGTSTKEFSSLDVTNPPQPISITITSPASKSSVQSLGQNGTLSPLPNVATVILDGTSQVIYKQTFTNLQGITAAENITTTLTQSNIQSASNAIPLVVAPVSIVVGAGGIWYRIGKIGPPIGPPDLPRLTMGSGVSLCKLFPFFCPGKKPSSPPKPADSPPNPDHPRPDPLDPSPKPVDESEPESEEASQSRGEPTGEPTSVPSNKPTSMPSSRPTSRPSSKPTSMPTSMPSSSQALISFNWVTETPSADAVFITSDDFSTLTSTMALYLQAQFTSMGIAFDQEDAMAGIGPMNDTTATATFASSVGKVTDIPTTATFATSAVKVTDIPATTANGAGAAAAAAILGDLASVEALIATRSSTAGLASASARVSVDNTVPTAAEEPLSSVLISTAPIPPRFTNPPIFPLACTQFIEVLQGGINPSYIHTCSCNDGSKPTATRAKSSTSLAYGVVPFTVFNPLMATAIIAHISAEDLWNSFNAVATPNLKAKLPLR